jgi:hypothetical protein
MDWAAIGFAGIVGSKSRRYALHNMHSVLYYVLHGCRDNYVVTN